MRSATSSGSSASDPPNWSLTVGDLAEHVGQVDRIVLDMLEPWSVLATVADSLVPGGVLTVYVPTTTQLSRIAEDLRGHGGFTEPAAWESLHRPWHLVGLAVPPGAPDDGPHRLPADRPPAGARGHRAAAAASADTGGR